VAILTLPELGYIAISCGVYCIRAAWLRDVELSRRYNEWKQKHDAEELARALAEDRRFLADLRIEAWDEEEVQRWMEKQRQS
jgi:hypothetical protein